MHIRSNNGLLRTNSSKFSWVPLSHCVYSGFLGIGIIPPLSCDRTFCNSVVIMPKLVGEGSICFDLLSTITHNNKNTDIRYTWL